MLTKKEWAIASIFSVIVFICFISISSSTPSVKKEEVKKQDIVDCIDAYVISHQYVEKILKSPSTAEFGVGSSNYRCTELENGYIINSHVDSQNSFGAMIRSEYTVDITYLGDGNWTLVTLIFDDEVLYSTEE